MSSSTRLSLEDFGAPAVAAQVPAPVAPQSTAPTPSPDLSEVYEKGYRAGWDDCLQGSKTEQKHIAEALGKRLGEAQLSADQTRELILGGLKPLLADIVQKLLPSLAQAGFRQQMIDEIMELAHTVTDAKVEVRVSQDDFPSVKALIEAHEDIPEVALSADPALGLTQAHLKLGTTGRSIDILHVVDGIEAAFDAVLNEQKDLSHG